MVTSISFWATGKHIAILKTQFPIIFGIQVGVKHFLPANKDFVQYHILFYLLPIFKRWHLNYRCTMESVYLFNTENFCCNTVLDFYVLCYIHKFCTHEYWGIHFWWYLIIKYCFACLKSTDFSITYCVVGIFPQVLEFGQGLILFDVNPIFSPICCQSFNT